MIYYSSSSGLPPFFSPLLLGPSERACFVFKTVSKAELDAATAGDLSNLDMYRRWPICELYFEHVLHQQPGYRSS